jgi:hypothetical protein
MEMKRGPHCPKGSLGVADWINDEEASRVFGKKKAIGADRSASTLHSRLCQSPTNTHRTQNKIKRSFRLKK